MATGSMPRSRRAPVTASRNAPVLGRVGQAGELVRGADRGQAPFDRRDRTPPIAARIGFGGDERDDVLGSYRKRGSGALR
jgi:hypothetical protein